MDRPAPFGPAPQHRLSEGKILAFWLPLAAMWLMMAVEGPLIAAVIARLPDPQPNLAAYGITFSLALLVESPIIMLLTAGTALPRGRQSYRRLLGFTHLLSGGLTLAHLLVALPPVYRFLVGTLIGAPQPVVELSRVSFLLMTPWTASIAYRRLWQGVLIRFHRTRVVPLTIGARLAVSLLILITGLTLGRLPGSYVGALALSTGVMTAALVAHALVRATVRRHLSRPSPRDEPLSWRELLDFYLPLALTPLVMLLSRPLLTVGLARAPQPLDSLAAWPVIMGLLFLGTAAAISYQEVAVALLRDRDSFARLRRFAWMLSLSLTGLFALVALTPAARLWYGGVSGLPPRLVEFAILPTAILALMPGFGALVAWQRGLLVHGRRTRKVTQAVVVNVLVLAAVMLAGLRFLPVPGAVVAALAMSASVVAEWLYLAWSSGPAAARVLAVPAGGAEE